MIIRELLDLPEDVASVAIIYSGSGDPSEQHEIIGIAFLDSDGNFIAGIGDTEGKPDKEGYGTLFNN